MFIKQGMEKHAFDEDYHTASKNPAAAKFRLVSHQIHYSDDIRELVASAPLRIDGRRRLPLPPPAALPEIGLDKIIEGRRSRRDFDCGVLRSDHLSAILYLANGVRAVAGSIENSVYQRNVPNSGNLGSVEIYLVSLNVESLEPGIYHFDSVRREVVLLNVGRYATWLREHVLYQVEFSRASVALILTASVGRLRQKYGARGYRLALLDVGHVSENLYLTAAALGLSVCATAGFIDDEVNRALGLDGVDNAAVLFQLIG